MEGLSQVAHLELGQEKGVEGNGLKRGLFSSIEGSLFDIGMIFRIILSLDHESLHRAFSNIKYQARSIGPNSSELPGGVVPPSYFNVD